MTSIPVPARNPSLRRACLGGTAALALLLAADTAAAQTASLPTLVVTPTGGSPVPEEEVGNSLTVITAQEIEEQHYETLPEALRAVPGLHVVQSGPNGALTSVFTRGANSNQTLVLLNGRPIGDPSASNGAFNFAHLPLFNVQQIEVLRGPASALYGSQAIGGVVNIITKGGEGEPSVGGLVEVGTKNSLTTVANANGRFEGIGFDLTLSRLHTDGFSITPDNLRPSGAADEADGYTNLSGSLALDAELTETLSASFFGAIVDTEMEVDTDPEDPDSREVTRQIFLDGALAGSFFDGVWRPTLSAGYSDYERNDRDWPDNLDLLGFGFNSSDVDNEGSRWNVELRNDIAIDENNVLSIGGRFEQERFSSEGVSDFAGFVITQDSEAERDTWSVYGQHRFSWDDRFFVTGSLRYDAPEDSDNALTWSIAPLYHHKETGTKIRGSVGTAFKAPSLYELYGFSPTNFGNAFRGNPDLDPERSFGWEVGVEQSLFDERVIVGATWFHNDIEDAINTVFTPTFDSTTVNNRDLETYGLEAFIDVVPVESVHLRLAYTFTETEFQDDGSRAFRRPRHQFNGTLAIEIVEGLTVTGNVLAAGERYDLDYNSGAPIKPEAYTLVNMAVDYEVIEGLSVFARAENLLDAEYETADGFAGEGVQLFVGLRARY